MEVVVWQHWLLFFAATAFALYLVPFFTQTAFKLGVLDNPDGDLKIHKAPVPYMGGVAIFLSFLGAVGLFYPVKERIVWLLIGATLLMFVGFIDDLKRIKPSRKLLGQFLGVACFMHGGLVIKQSFFSSFANIGISVFWMLALINAVNLIDIMDGLAALVAGMSLVGFAVIALMAGQYGVSLLLIALIGALFGFFWYNKPEAKIYMGDAGSLFIGGVLAAVPLLIKWSSMRPDAYLAALIIPAIPLIEVASLVVIRTAKKIPFYRGSQDHFAIYLQNKGWSRWLVLQFCFFMGLYLNLSVAAYIATYIDIFGLAALGIIFCIGWWAAVFSPLFIFSGSKFAAARLVKKEIESQGESVTRL